MNHEEKVKVQEPHYWLEAKSDGPILKFCLLVLGEDKGVTKLSRILDIEKERRELVQFETAKEVIKLMRSRENYEVDLHNFTIALNWRVQAIEYQKTVLCKVSLFPENISKLEKLELQNAFLRLRLSKYEASQTKDNEHSLSPKLSQGYPHLPHSDSCDASSREIEPQPGCGPLQVEEEQIIEISSSKESSHFENEERKSAGRKSISIRESDRRKPIKKEMYKVGSRKRKAKRSTSRVHPIGKEGKVTAETSKKQMQKNRKEEVVLEIQRKKVNSRKTKEGDGENQEKGRIKIGERYRIDYCNGDYYFGEMKDGKYHGYGIYCSKTSGKYEGGWVDGHAEGQGESYDSDGNKHEGLYHEDMKAGWGVDYYANGEKYEGEFERDCKHGLGKYWFLNGESYEGQWRNDLCHGPGVETFQDGSFFSGRWVEDEKDGEGMLTTVDGDRFKQVWKAGRLEKEIQA